MKIIAVSEGLGHLKVLYESFSGLKYSPRPREQTMSFKSLLGIGLICLLCACGTAEDSSPGPVEAGTNDAGTNETGTNDATSTTDTNAASQDTASSSNQDTVGASTDTTAPDALEPDTISADTSEPDASEPDASEPDASEPDTSSADTTQPTFEPRKSVKKGYFQLVDALDEPEFYCLDIPGFKSSLKLDSPLMMHTCKIAKGGGDDELFAWNEPANGQIHAYKYARCAQASQKQAGATVKLVVCGADPMQQWVITTDGQIRLANSGLCMAADNKPGTKVGGVSNLRRNMRLQDCATYDSKLTTWKFPGT